jgi:hypothetical protein
MKLGGYVANMYQFGYVTKDIDRAIAHFGETQGIEQFFQIEIDAAARLNGEEAPFVMRVALANIGDKQVELIQPIRGVYDFYTQGLDLDRSVVALHHVGLLVKGPESAWDEMRESVQAGGRKIVLEDMIPRPSSQHFAYLDTRADYGHYLEFLWRGPEAQKFHESMPDQIR